MNQIIMITCKSCGNKNIIATCKCGRKFVITESHLNNQIRKFEDKAASDLPKSFIPPDCDFCTAKKNRDSSPPPVTAGLNQKTCPFCHTQCC